jgi:hypothetical protein
MHVDLIPAASSTLMTRLVVEPDERSHEPPEAKGRDGFKNAAPATGGVPLLGVIVAGRYGRGALRARIMETMGAVARSSRLVVPVVPADPSARRRCRRHSSSR